MIHARGKENIIPLGHYPPSPVSLQSPNSDCSLSTTGAIFGSITPPSCATRPMAAMRARHIHASQKPKNTQRSPSHVSDSEPEREMERERTEKWQEDYSEWLRDCKRVKRAHAGNVTPPRAALPSTLHVPAVPQTFRFREGPISPTPRRPYDIRGISPRVAYQKSKPTAEVPTHSACTETVQGLQTLAIRTSAQRRRRLKRTSSHDEDYPEGHKVYWGCRRQ